MQTLSVIADVASLIGLALTAVVAWQVKAIRAQFLLRARIPALLNKLTELASALSEELGKKGNRGQAEEAVRRILAILAVIAPKLAKIDRATIETVRSRIHQLTYRGLDESVLKQIYLATLEAVETLDDVKESLQWQK